MSQRYTCLGRGSSHGEYRTRAMSSLLPEHFDTAIANRWLEEVVEDVIRPTTTVLLTRAIEEYS